ncbi:uncharacterized protein LOC126717269 isoform X2 [Quercus robur]|uniref:uncharacterized protein LOC126717269 isoform X2 n=2 Tax=Quercus robur TaxID=38942 RepID=UPI002163D07E|nr:uncharacterized protein LOC126717269 isoform X2 [Quercus robur]
MGSLGQHRSKGEIELRWYQGSFYWSRYKLILMNVRFESKSVIRQETLSVELMNFIMKDTNYRRLCSTKTVSSVNDNFPGPTIPDHKWDTVFVNIHDRGKYGITIHWHGIRQPRNPWSDGLKNIMKCPIPLNTSFTQEIIFFIEKELYGGMHIVIGLVPQNMAPLLFYLLWEPPICFLSLMQKRLLFLELHIVYQLTMADLSSTHNQFHNECRTMFWNC